MRQRAVRRKQGGGGRQRRIGVPLRVLVERVLGLTVGMMTELNAGRQTFLRYVCGQNKIVTGGGGILGGTCV